MEKSMIQDLNLMRSSTGPKNNFTTSYCEGGFDLRRSKINNLPNHKKTDLSVRLPFVIVFQTMEIQRLSQEIETLRVSLKDYEHQIFISQNYQVQIKELTDQCFNYDQQLTQYKDQVQKLNMISQNLFDELESWKNKYGEIDPNLPEKFQVLLQENSKLNEEISKWKDRYRALEKSKDRQLEDLRQSMDSQRKSMIDRQIQQMSLKFDTERKQLQNFIKKLQQAGEHQDQQRKLLQSQLQGLEIAMNQKNALQWKLKEAQDQIMRLSNECYQLNDLLRRKQEELDFKSQNEENLLHQIQALQRECAQSQNQITKIAQLESESKDLMAKCSQLQRDFDKSSEKAKKLPEIEQHLQAANAQLERLSWVIRSKIDELSQKEKELQKMGMLCDELRRQEQKIPLLEQKLNKAQHENNRVESLSRKRVAELEDSKKNQMELEKVIRGWEEAEPRKKKIQEEHSRIVRQNQELNRVLGDLQNQNRRIPDLENIIREEQRCKEECINEINRLNNVVRELDSHNSTMQEKCAYLTQQLNTLNDLRNQLEGYKTQNHRITQMLDKLKGQIAMKQEELLYIKEQVVQMSNQLHQYGTIQQKLKQNLQDKEKLIRELEGTRNQLENASLKLLEAEKKISQSQFLIMQMNEEKEMLKRNLTASKNEIELKIRQIKQQENQIQNLKEIENRFYKAMKELERLQRQNEEQTCRMKEQQSKLEEMQYLCENMRMKIEKMQRNGYFPPEFKQIFQAIKSKCTSQKRQFQMFREHKKHISRDIEKVKGMIAECCNQSGTQNNILNSEILPKINEMMQKLSKITQLQDQNSQLKLDNLSLQSNIKMMNLEMTDAENRKISATSFKTISSFTSKATNDSALTESNITGENNPYSTSRVNYSQIKMNKGSFRSASPYTSIQGSYTYRC